MPRYVAFLRAVNVGKRQLSMAQAREVLESDGFSGVESHIQSGNLLVSTSLRSPAKVGTAISATLSAHAGFDIVTMVRTPRELVRLVEAVDGIPPALSEQASRYVSFCLTEPAAESAAALESWDAPGERAKVMGHDVLMELSVPFNQVTLTGARIERILGVPGTARNLTVVRALAQKWGDR